MMFEPKLQALFNRFHKILGFDTEEARAKTLINFEHTLGARVLSAVLASLNVQQRERYRQFVEAVPSPSEKECARFLENFIGASEVERIANAEMKKLTEEYVRKITAHAANTQKDEIKSAIAQFVKDTGFVPPKRI